MRYETFVKGIEEHHAHNLPVQSEDDWFMGCAVRYSLGSKLLDCVVRYFLHSKLLVILIFLDS